MDHCLLVARLVVSEQVRILGESLANAREVAVAEDPEAALDEAVLDAVALRVLGGKESNQRLRHREADGAHVSPRSVPAESHRGQGPPGRCRRQ